MSLRPSELEEAFYLGEQVEFLRSEIKSCRKEIDYIVKDYQRPNNSEDYLIHIKARIPFHGKEQRSRCINQIKGQRELARMAVKTFKDLWEENKINFNKIFERKSYDILSTYKQMYRTYQSARKIVYF